MNNLYRLILLLVLSGLFACDKKDKAVGSTYVFSNPYDFPLNVDIYSAVESYTAANSIHMELRIEPYMSASVDKNKLPQQKYYIDCYSDDHIYNNWLGYDVPFLEPENGFHPSLRVSTAKALFLKNTEIYSRWKAVDALSVPGGQSVWSLIPESDKHLVFTVRRNFTTLVEHVQYGVPVIDSLYAFVYNPDTTKNITFGFMRDNYAYSPNVEIVKTASPDSLLCYHKRLYLVVRQN
jgi:hypothetical protein